MSGRLKSVLQLLWCSAHTMHCTCVVAIAWTEFCTGEQLPDRLKDLSAAIEEQEVVLPCRAAVFMQ